MFRKVTGSGNLGYIARRDLARPTAHAIEGIPPVRRDFPEGTGPFACRYMPLRHAGATMSACL